ncbi:nucleoside hydrolase [Aestuariibius insulae]|uniref:nucleoside hydrolase n=1 Tax=Aestuariibius insulae TaxID=2058287 RepID=UPI00345ED5FE
MMRVLIDTDPGIDDAMAIYWAAAAPEIEIAGITTVFGNVSSRIAGRNALRLLEAAGVEAPVAEGAWQPLVLPPFEPTWRIHGREGFGTVPAELPAGKVVDEAADDMLLRMTAEAPGELTLVALGPLTNVASALRRDPDFAGRLAGLVIMGGSVDAGGNITPHAEANLYHDPHAAEIVFASGAPIRMVGLDVTHQILCAASDFANIAHRSPVIGGQIQEMSLHYLKFYESVGRFDGCALHDPAAMIAAVAPDLFEWRKTPIRVVTEGEASGRTLADPACGAPPVAVAMGVDADAVRHRFIETLAMLP